MQHTYKYGKGLAVYIFRGKHVIKVLLSIYILTLVGFITAGVGICAYKYVKDGSVYHFDKHGFYNQERLDQLQNVEIMKELLKRRRERADYLRKHPPKISGYVKNQHITERS